MLGRAATLAFNTTNVTADWARERIIDRSNAAHNVDH
jgi:hypothetical protein